MQKITTFLWFDGQAEEAANFYTSVFNGSKITGVLRQGPEGPVMSVNFELEGQEFIALNGGPHFRFTEAISLFVKCDTQEEIDRKWEQLTSGGGAESMCGWLKDKFGLSWQIIPPVLGELMQDEDPKKAAAVMQAMLKMKKIDIAGLKKAYNEA